MSLRDDLRGEVDVVIEGDPDRYDPVCPVCQQVGFQRAAGFSDRQFICAECGARWIVQPSIE